MNVLCVIWTSNRLQNVFYLFCELSHNGAGIFFFVFYMKLCEREMSYARLLKYNVWNIRCHSGALWKILFNNNLFIIIINHLMFRLWYKTPMAIILKILNTEISGNRFFSFVNYYNVYWLVVIWVDKGCW